MKFSRRIRRRGDKAKKSSLSDRTGSMTTPRVGSLRKDAPAQAIDLSTDAFRNNFPRIAQRMDDRNVGHRRRSAEQAAVQPPPAAGEETNDT